MTRCLRIILALFLIPTLQAGTIEVAQWMPWEFVKENLIPQSIEASFQESSMNLTVGEYHPKLHHIRGTLQGQMTDTHFDKDGIEGNQNLNVQIEVGKIEIDQVIERVVNGNIIRVTLKAECSPFQINVNQIETSAALTYKFQEYWRPTLENLSVKIKDGQWEISEIQCSGIEGLGQQVAMELSEAFGRPDSFLDMVKTWLAQEVSSRFDLGWKALVQNTNASLASIGKPSDRGIMISAHLPIKSNKHIVLTAQEDHHFSANIPQLILSKDGFEALLEDKIVELIPQNYDLQGVKSFRKLLKSKLLQFFVWPDLKRFNSKTPFLLQTNLDQTRLSLGPSSQGQWAAMMNSNGILKTVVGDAEIDYISYGLSLRSDLSVEVRDSKLHLTTMKPDLKLSWSFGLLYQLLFKPTKRISTDILRSSISQFFNNKSVSAELPTIKFNGHEWKLQNFKQNKELITMDWL